MPFDLFILSTLVAAALGFAVRRVPEGPACPRCGMLTRPRAELRARVFWPLERLTFAATCPSCGWDGRLRGPRLQPARERRERGGAR